MYKVYQVENGETIESIANKLNISKTYLMDLNSLYGEVETGDLIVIPNQNSTFESYIVKKGDTLYEISKKTNVDIEDLIKINGLDKDEYIYPGQEILIPKKGFSLYITKEETLKDISEKLGLTPADIVNQNEYLNILPEQLIIYRN